MFSIISVLTGFDFILTIIWSEGHKGNRYSDGKDDRSQRKATVKVVYYVHKTLKDGSHPFVVRITKNRKNRWVSTGKSLATKYWNYNYTDYRQAIRKSYPEPYRNELILELERWEKSIEVPPIPLPMLMKYMMPMM